MKKEKGKEIIEAEIVAPAPADELSAELALVPVKALRPPKAKPAKRKGKTFTPVTLYENGKYEHGQLSERERKFVLHYIKTGSVIRAAEEIGVHSVTGSRYLARPRIKAYVQHMRARAAKAADLTMDKVGAVMGAAVAGDPNITPLQIQAATAAAKWLRPAGPVGVHIGTLNQQTNNHLSVGASPFAELDQAGMLGALKKNLLEMSVEALDTDLDPEEEGE